jgi:NAD(P)-dependent dehydrogenase (short-subunit alcohol dehydrogenase family)
MFRFSQKVGRQTKMKDKFAVVTGASTGIGRAIALAFAKEGANVALVGKNEEKLLETSNLIEKAGGKSKIFECDLANVISLNILIASIKEKTKMIDILVNVAGIWHGKDEVYAGKNFDSFTESVVTDTYAVGLIAPTLLSHAFIPLMPKGSSIINLSGTFENGGKGWLPYYVSKRAIEDLTIGLSQELADKGIRVNCVSPSDTATEEYKKFFPEDAKDAQLPEKVANLFVELANNDETGKVFVIKKGKVEEGFHR